MTTLSALATHDGANARAMGLRRAVIARHAVLGDCTTLRDNARAVLSRSWWRRPGCVVPLGDRRHRHPSAADLAVGVARRLLESRPDVAAGRVGAVIYCHEAPDERMSESTVGRLQHELSLHAANPLAISQSHNTAAWLGLELALGLIDGPERVQHVLLVASDKLLFCGLAADARHLVFGDVAAAALLSRGDAAGWAVEQLVVRQFATPHDALSRWPAADVAEFAAFGAALVQQVLRDAGSHPDAVIAVTADQALAQGLHRACGLPPAALRRHASSADLLLALAAIEPSSPAGSHVLAWGAGNNGEFACCMLRRR